MAIKLSSSYINQNVFNFRVGGGDSSFLIFLPNERRIKLVLFCLSFSLCLCGGCLFFLIVFSENMNMFGDKTTTQTVFFIYNLFSFCFTR